GPATDVRLYIQPGTSLSGEYLRIFGAVSKDGIIHDGDLMEWPISVKKRNERSYLLAYYTDTFGQYFESSRDIDIGKTIGNLIIGPLIVRKLDKGKNRDLIESIWLTSTLEAQND
ncbi:MAG: hypothetical protein U9N44_08335, partial [Chloroflexota bacterium]|nr:hypothetical protein [Chloroflexota bacterium]